MDYANYKEKNFAKRNFKLTMTKTTEKSFAKLNLALDVISRLENGYHELSMIMQSIELHDIVTVELQTRNEILISCNKDYIPTDERNVAYKAAAAFMDEFGERFGVNIDIQKSIPVGGGLAGGSSNAASVLIGLNKLTRFPFDNEVLMKIGKTVGADVPFCMAAQLAKEDFCAIAEGIGEQLTPIENKIDAIYVLVKPKFSISTKWAFTNLDIAKVSRHPNISAVVSGIKDGDFNIVAKNTANVLEGVVSARYPLIEKLKNDMRSFGSKFCLMSGSGSTVFGAFDDKRKAYSAFEHFDKTQEFAWIGK